MTVGALGGNKRGRRVSKEGLVLRKGEGERRVGVGVCLQEMRANRIRWKRNVELIRVASGIRRRRHRGSRLPYNLRGGTAVVVEIGDCNGIAVEENLDGQVEVATLRGRGGRRVTDGKMVGGHEPCLFCEQEYVRARSSACVRTYVFVRALSGCVPVLVTVRSSESPRPTRAPASCRFVPQVHNPHTIDHIPFDTTLSPSITPLTVCARDR
jgi:hypothetical protein